MAPIGNPQIDGRLALASMLAQSGQDPSTVLNQNLAGAMSQTSTPVGPMQQATPNVAQAMPMTPYGKPMIEALQTPQMGPVPHPLEALARALMPVAGNYQQGRNMAVERQQGDMRNQALAQALATYKGGDQAGAMTTPNLSSGAQEAFLGAALKPGDKPADYTIGNQRFNGVTNQVIATGQSDSDKPPPGFMNGAPGMGYTPVPGGPHDPATIAAEAAARNPFVLQQNYNPQTNAMETIAVPLEQVMQAMQQGGGVVGSKPVPPDQGQTAAGGFANRLQTANSILAQVDNQGGDAMAAFLAGAPGGNYLQSPEYQQFDQAKRDFINAVLRRESGASISPQEFDNASRQYFPVPGDSPQVIAQKRQAREMAVTNMVQAAGPGYRPQTQAAPAAPQAPIAINPQTGEKRILQDGQWVPYNG